MRAILQRWLVPVLGRVCIALAVLVSANHCFLEEGLRGAGPVTASVPFDYHFGAAFPHQHSTTDQEHSGEAQHPHGDAMSTQSESLFLKNRKADSKLVALFSLSLLKLSPVARTGYEAVAIADERALPLNYECEKSLASLSCAPQAPPRHV